MTISKELADLRTGHPGCQAVIIADLSTGMVLAASTAEKTTQEKLDAVCSQARACLGRDGQSAAIPDSADSADDAPFLAWHSDGVAIRCFVRAPAPAAEALCLVATADAPLQALCREGRKILSRIAAEC